MTRAAWWYRHQTRRTLRNLRDPRWSILLSVSPDNATLSPVWPGDLARLPQGRGNLGQRMSRALSATPGPSVLIGSDIPGIANAHIARAFAAFGTAETVIGPAKDGGFWLVGLKHPGRAPKSLFRNTRWSHPDTLADTLPTLPQPLALVDTLSDFDTAQDL